MAADRPPAEDPAPLDLASVWAEFGDAIDGFVRRRIRDPHAAEEVVADVMLRIHQGVGAVDDHERVTAWIFRVARNAVTDHYRRSGRRREIPSVDVPAPVVDDASWAEESREALAAVAACVRPLVAALPSDYRRALELTDLDGRSQVEAARIEGISVSGMKSRVQRGRRRLLSLVEECCEITTDRRGDIIEVDQRDEGCGCPAPA